MMKSASNTVEPQPESTRRKSVATYLARAQPITVSALLHAVLLIIVGGTVLLETRREPDFTAGDRELVSKDTPASAPPEQPKLQQTDLPPNSDAMPAPVSPLSLSPIISNAPKPSDLNLVMTTVPNVSNRMDQLDKPLTPPSPPAQGLLSKALATKIANFTGNWAKGGTASMSQPLKSREFQFTAYLAKYSGGDWDSTVWMRDGDIAGGSLTNLLYVVGKLSKGRIHADPQLVPLDLSSDDIFAKKPPFIWFTGHQDFKLTEKEVANLAEYLRNGGCLWGDSSVPGKRSRFDIAFRREMQRLVPPGEKWQSLPATHPIYQANYFPEIQQVPSGVNFYHEPVYALNGYGGTIAILYTANDYGDMWQFGLDDNGDFDFSRDEKRRMVATNEEMWHRRHLYFRNIDPKTVMDSYKFGTNVITHLLTRWEDKLRTTPKSL
jgi:hypothetical protein